MAPIHSTPSTAATAEWANRPKKARATPETAPAPRAVFSMDRSSSGPASREPAVMPTPYTASTHGTIEMSRPLSSVRIGETNV